MIFVVFSVPYVCDILFDLVYYYGFEGRGVDLARFIFARLCVFVIRCLVRVRIGGLVSVFRDGVFYFYGVGFEGGYLTCGIGLSSYYFGCVAVIFAQYCRFRAGGEDSICDDYITNVDFYTPGQIQDLFCYDGAVFNGVRVAFYLIGTVVVRIGQFGRR